MSAHEADQTALEAALARWLRALASRGAPEAVDEAVEPEVCVERVSAMGPHTGEVVEVFAGAANVGRWLALTPPTLAFRLAGPPLPSVAGGVAGWQVGYLVSGEDFENGGLWLLRLGPSGRIAWLMHAPRPLGVTAATEVRDHLAAWRTYVGPLAEAHEHAHGCAHEAEGAGQVPEPH